MRCLLNCIFRIQLRKNIGSCFGLFFVSFYKYCFTKSCFNVRLKMFLSPIIHIVVSSYIANDFVIFVQILYSLIICFLWHFHRAFMSKRWNFCDGFFDFSSILFDFFSFISFLLFGSSEIIWSKILLTFISHIKLPPTFPHPTKTSH